VQVLVTVEMPVAGGFYMSHSVNTIRLHPYIEKYQLFYLAVQLLFFVLTGIFVVRTVRDLMTLGVAFYGSLRCWLDLFLAASSVMMAAMFIDYSVALYDASERPHDMRYGRLFYSNRLLLAADGFVGLFAILRALMLCRYIPTTSRVLAVMDKSSSYVVSSVVFGLIVWLMLSSSASALFGYDVVELRNFGTSMCSTLYASARLYHYSSLLPACFFVMVVVLLFVCVARVLCVLPMLASFHDVQQLPDSDQARLYFEQLAQNFRDAISCVGFRIRRKKDKQQQTAKII